MRSFIIAAIILSSIFILTAVNTAYVTSKTEEILDICEEIKRGSSAHDTDDIMSVWQSCRDIISLSTHRNDVERAENALFVVMNFERGSEDFDSQLETLISALEHIHESQSFSLENIF